MGQKNSFQDVLNRVDEALKRAKEQAMAVRWFYAAGNMEQAYEKALLLEQTTEKTVLLTRKLPAYSGKPATEIVIDAILKNTIPVEIGFTKEGWFCVRLPCLLPKKAGGSADYIRSFLFPAMKRFFLKKKPVCYTDCVLAFRHVYSRDRPQRQMRDHDNIEVNMVSDIVTLYVMPDDSPKVCNHYYCSAEASDDRTEVYVIPQYDFPRWLNVEKIMPDRGVKLYETMDLDKKKHM